MEPIDLPDLVAFERAFNGLSESDRELIRRPLPWGMPMPDDVRGAYGRWRVAAAGLRSETAPAAPVDARVQSVTYGRAEHEAFRAGQNAFSSMGASFRGRAELASVVKILQSLDDTYLRALTAECKALCNEVVDARLASMLFTGAEDALRRLLQSGCPDLTNFGADELALEADCLPSLADWRMRYPLVAEYKPTKD